MAQRKYMVDINMRGNVVRNILLEGIVQGEIPPASDNNVGRILLDASTKHVIYSDGAVWQVLATASDIQPLTERVGTLETQVATLEELVGDDKKGLIHDVADLQLRVATNEDEIETLKKRADDLEEKTSAENFAKEVKSNVTANVRPELDAEKKRINFFYGEDEEPFAFIDASAFFIDGMLDDVVLVQNPAGYSEGTYIKFAFNTDAGKTDIYLNVTSLIDIYVAGDGLDIKDHQFSIKIAADSTAYLEVSSGGLSVKPLYDALHREIQELSADTVHIVTVQAVAGNARSVNIPKEVGQTVNIVGVQTLWKGEFVECNVSVVDSGTNATVSVSWNGDDITSTYPLTIHVHYQKLG